MAGPHLCSGANRKQVGSRFGHAQLRQGRLLRLWERRGQVSMPGHICAVVVTTLVLEGWSSKLDPTHSVMDQARPGRNVWVTCYAKWADIKSITWVGV